MEHKPWTLLLVDDEPQVLQLLANRLKAQGYAIVTALNADLAAIQLVQAKPHLVVCDVVMPGTDGPTFCKLVRARGDRTPFLFLTAKGQPQDIVEVLSAGGDDYLVKPFNGGELTARIQAILRRIYPSQTGPDTPHLPPKNNA